MLPDETGCCQCDQVLPNVTKCYQMWPDITKLEWNEKNFLHMRPLSCWLRHYNLWLAITYYVSRYARHASSLWPFRLTTHMQNKLSTCDMHNIMAIIILNLKDPARWHITNMTAHTSINIILPVRTRSWAFWAKLLTVKHPPQWLPGQTFYGILHRLVTILVTGPCSIVNSNAFACTKNDLLFKNFNHRHYPLVPAPRAYWAKIATC